MRKWLIAVALGLSMGIGGVFASSASADSPFASSCDAGFRSDRALTNAGDRSEQAPSGGVRQGQERSSEFSQLNFCSEL